MKQYMSAFMHQHAAPLIQIAIAIECDCQLGVEKFQAVISHFSLTQLYVLRFGYFAVLPFLRNSLQALNINLNV